ncbi:MAG: thiamine diphosphokinase [Ignavibacteriae bacterium]|nr:thiamine diphosphokinase [Ignavibacteriota bacterium]
MPKRALILANGEPPKKSLLQSLVKQADIFVCADGGANAALKLGLKPDAIVGDMDSIHAETRSKFQRVPMHEVFDENSTDLEKVIMWTIKQHYEHITVAGTAGKRLDHTVGNLGVLAKFYPDAIITFIDNLGELDYVGHERTFESPLHTVVSLIPLTKCEGVTTKGLEYALENDSLEIGVREGTSNVVVSNPVVITVKKGNLLLYKLRP